MQVIPNVLGVERLQILDHSGYFQLWLGFTALRFLFVLLSSYMVDFQPIKMFRQIGRQYFTNPDMRGVGIGQFKNLCF